MSEEVEEVKKYICQCGEEYDMEEQAIDCCPPEEIIEYACPHCGQQYDDETEARDCCPIDMDIKYKCVECDQEYDEEEEAKECCTEKEEGDKDG